MEIYKSVQERIGTIVASTDADLDATTEANSRFVAKRSNDTGSNEREKVQIQVLPAAHGFTDVERPGREVWSLF